MLYFYHRNLGEAFGAGRALFLYLRLTLKDAGLSVAIVLGRGGPSNGV